MMNINSGRLGSASWIHRFDRIGLIFLLTLVGGLCHFASAQTADSRPVARLINPTTSRPRLIARLDAPPTSNPPSAMPSLEDANAIEHRAFDETNLARIRNGLTAFAWDADLCRLARAHSERMARQGFFSHITPDGQRLRDRARAAGIQHFLVLGENIAYNFGYNDPGAFAVERWMISPDHRANILNPEFRAMAIGTYVGADGSVFLTQVFITR
jgi:uncharacterized protein YkwD